MTSTKRTRGALTGLLAGSAALLVALTGAAASAAPGSGDSPLILPGEGGTPITATVTVHKHEQGSEPGAPATGLERPVNSEPIAGVEFTATQITGLSHPDDAVADVVFDLETNAGWQAAARADYDAATGDWTYNGVEDYTPITGHVAVTTTGGETYVPATFADLPVGLYLFEETDVPAGVTGSAPWVMTVPLTHPTERDSWLYDIHVYPKNSTTGAAKTVQDAGGVKVGDRIGWTILTDLPRVANPGYVAGQSLDTEKFLAPTAYVITDQLDDRLDYVSATVTVVNGASVSLTEGDYSIDGVGDGSGDHVKISFTETGLVKLGQAAADYEAQVKVELVTTVVSRADGTVGDGTITNKALLFPNKPAVESDTPTESPEVESRWGDILIHKVDATNTDTSLAGATFKLYDSLGNAREGSGEITINGVSEFTTNEDGVVRISGLRYSGWANGGTVEPGSAEYRSYWLVETKAPNGYELLSEPMEIIVDRAEQTVSMDGVTIVQNAPANTGFELPLTGGAGTAAFTLTGLLLVAGGIVLARRRNALAGAR